METQQTEDIERTACPYCGGDEARCDFNFTTDHCSEMDRMTERLRAIQGEWKCPEKNSLKRTLKEPEHTILPFKKPRMDLC
jgi:hypothetical protein